MQEPVICGVYKITNIINGKFYIGSSKNIYSRWYQHKKKLNDNIHGNAHLQNAWNKYGEKNFKFEIIEQCINELQFEREQYYLNKLNPFDNNGYNIVRQISKEYMSDHYMIKKCDMCGNDYSTFSNLAKYCEECKKEMRYEDYKEKKLWTPKNITDNDVLSWGYDSWDDFWESNI